MEHKQERILILCKTYPSPSAKYSETSCVAGVTEDGKLCRLYPVPFRLIHDDQQFKKWQWINARVYKSPSDHRPESHKVYVDTIQCEPEALSTKDNWRERRIFFEKILIFTNFGDVESRRKETNESLALIRPKRIVSLEIRKAESTEWTTDEKEKLIQLQNQGNLFENQEEEKQLRLLKKLPFDFYYRYECDTINGLEEKRHKLVDWEVGALFWNCWQKYQAEWEKPFRAKLETEFAEKDLIFLMGNIHRFQDQWLIVSLIYPPKQRPEAERQSGLF